jgi:hypothetical protein
MAEPFNGSWSIDLERSRVWDADNDTWVCPDPIGREDLTFYTDGDTYDQTISVGLNPTYHMGYSCKWNGDWAPYMCRSIEYPETPIDVRHPRMDLGPATTFGPNQPTAWIKMIKVSDTFHYRISINQDRQNPGYVMSRNRDASEEWFRSTVMSPGGDVVIIRYFNRVA